MQLVLNQSLGDYKKISTFNTFYKITIILHNYND